MSTEKDIFLNAFPSAVSNLLKSQITESMLKAEHESQGSFTVLLHGERISIPYRVYCDVINFSGTDQVSILLGKALNAFYTRHHDGFVREKALKSIIRYDDYWLIPYKIRLISEYIEKFAEIISDTLDEDKKVAYARFLTENPDFLEITNQRIASYWNEYYRNEFPNLAEYPPKLLLMDIMSKIT